MLPSTKPASKIFDLMRLPAELREEIYYQACEAFPPIDLASIADTPDRVKVPLIAQLNRQTRSEALAVFFRSRPLIISLNCDRNIQRARSWLAAIGGTTELGSTIVLVGTGRKLSRGETYRVTIRGEGKEGHFRVESRPAASPQSDAASMVIQAGVEQFLRWGNEGKAEERRGKVTAAEIKKMLEIVLRHADYEEGRKRSRLG